MKKNIKWKSDEASFFQVVCLLLRTQKEVEITYSEFRYLWNVGEVKKDNVARLRDITKIMTVAKVSVFRALERLEKSGKARQEKIQNKGVKINYICPRNRAFFIKTFLLVLTNIFVVVFL